MNIKVIITRLFPIPELNKDNFYLKFTNVIKKYFMEIKEENEEEIKDITIFLSNELQEYVIDVKSILKRVMCKNFELHKININIDSDQSNLTKFKLMTCNNDIKVIIDMNQGFSENYIKEYTQMINYFYNYMINENNDHLYIYK